MDLVRLRALLGDVRDGSVAVEACVELLARLPYEDLGHTRFDTHRAVRLGHAEVIFGEGKAPEELLDVVKAARVHHERLLVTRVPPAARAGLEALAGARWRGRSRTMTFGEPTDEVVAPDPILVVSAGTSDAAVAEEAWVTARLLGQPVRWLPDVGIAGLHRLLAVLEELRGAAVLVVVAGMEGALPSVVAGLVDRPVIAVPTSIGYGASFGGLAALLAMLNSCAPGVTVTNIDNGFGGAFAAARIRANRAGVASPADSRHT
ncbi:MAG: nickel pincer cofactor biosynthesis protein LarB [Planctomycetota bacterium]